MDKQLLDITNYASGQSDRWLFVCLLVIGLAAVFTLFRYFTGRLDVLQTRMDKQTEEFVEHLKTANSEMRMRPEACLWPWPSAYGGARLRANQNPTRTRSLKWAK